MASKKKMENNWKNCYCVSDETHAFCFQWEHQRDFRRVAAVVESVIPGANCSLKIPEHPGSRTIPICVSAALASMTMPLLFAIPAIGFLLRILMSGVWIAE